MVTADNCPAWNALDWKKIHYHVRSFQERIALAAEHGDWKAVRSLQRMVFASWDCRVFAVHRVTCRKAVRTAGLDGIFWHTDESRFAAVERLLVVRTYNPMPFKRIYIPKDHDKSKKRPLSVPTIYDRAVQALYLIAVEPVVEHFAGKHDYGCRLYRSSQDTVRDVVSNFGFDTGMSYFLKADVKQCFDHLSHSWILEHSPMNRKLLKKIMKSGYIWNGKYYPTDEGMPQGGVLSPALTNLCLNGFEFIIERKYGTAVHMVRFVDDFLFSGATPDILTGVLADLKQFLDERGLYVSDDKTVIGSIYDGVDYIGWHFAVNEYGLIVSPAQIAVDELMARLKNALREGRNWTGRRLIKKLNGIVRGWGGYHGYLCSPDKFVQIDDDLQDMLWQWAVAKHRHHKPRWIYQHHWKLRPETRRKEFSSEDVYLLRFSEIRVKMKTDLDLSKNPYLDRAYFRSINKQIALPRKLKRA